MARPELPSSVPPAFRFSPLKNRGAIKLNVISGIALPAWLSLLWRHWRDIDWITYWHRVLFLSFMAVVNSLLAIPDWLLYHRRIAGQQLNAEPVFILGAPRSGTTHLHNLLSLDPHFAFATTFQAGFPSSFLTLERAGGRAALQPLLSETRPMDNMKLTWELPAEDEIAVTLLSGCRSYYAPLTLPRQERTHQRPLLTLERATQQDFTAWQDALLWFLKKVTFGDCLRRARAARPPGRQAPPAPWPGPRPLLIKSPVHTARLGLWRRLFPRARYIYIHRHPLDVFRSHVHMIDSYFTYCYLNLPTDEMSTDYILSQGATCHESYVAERARVPAAQRVEVRFTDLDADPLGTLRRIYTHFGWAERFASLEPKFKAYTATLSDFKKNSLKPLAPEVEARVRREWAPAFTEWAYA